MLVFLLLLAFLLFVTMKGELGLYADFATK